MFHAELVHMITICLHIKFHVPSYNGSLAIVTELKTRNRFHAVAMSMFHTSHIYTRKLHKASTLSKALITTNLVSPLYKVPLMSLPAHNFAHLQCYFCSLRENKITRFGCPPKA